MDKLRLIKLSCYLSIFLWSQVLGIVSGAESSKEIQGRNAMVRIYFIPFSVETYVPITMNEIEARAFHIIWLTKEHTLGLKLRRLVTALSSKTRFDDRVVRLKIQFDGETFHIDKDGTVFHTNSGNTYHVSRKQVSDIETDILHLSGVVDVKAGKDMGLVR